VFPAFGSENELPIRVTDVCAIEVTDAMLGVFGGAFEAAPVVKATAKLQELQFPLLSRYRTRAR
jgi:hypothetical protein